MLHHRGGQTPAQEMRGVAESSRQLRTTKSPIKALDQICSRAPCSIYDEPLTLPDELQSSQTCVTVLADDDMVVEEMPTGLAM